MRAGNNYKLNISFSPASEGEEVIIKYITTSAVLKQVNKLKKIGNVDEDAAAQNFRLAYMLRESRYTPDAFIYYKKASALDSANGFYKEKLGEFKKDFFVE
jgi:hypothetical protein